MPLSASDAPVLVAACAHCGTALATESTSPYCCSGCEFLHGVLVRAGLERFYELGGRAGIPATNVDGKERDHKWLEPLVATLRGATSLERIALDIQGVHCTGCVWLLEEIFRRADGGVGILVNSSRATIDLTVHPHFPLEAFVRDVERFGYVLGPRERAERSTSDDLLTRFGVAVAIAMNSMIFAIATYAGLREGNVYRIVVALNFALTCVSVVVGGSVFFRSAWEGLKRRVLHLDLPIALGIAFAFASSTFASFSHEDGAAYFDTLNVFIALMLLGRLLQERVLEKNRRFLLESTGAEKLLTRRIDTDGVSLVRADAVRKGDRLLVATGDLVVVPSTLDDDGGAFSLDWISGESRPIDFARGDRVPAGAFSCDRRPKTLVADDDFSKSPIVTLLETPLHDTREAPTSFWARFSRVYVLAVLVIATITAVVWFVHTRDLVRTSDVVAAVLIVTCPCAFGIATPLAYELAQAGLRRRGLFVRSSTFLDRAVDVRHLAFDKTGTLTFGDLTLARPAVLDALAPSDRAVLAAMVVRSSHPKSRAVARALGSGRTANVEVHETPGRGLEAESAGAVYRLGAASFARGDAPEVTDVDARNEVADLVFAKDGVEIAELATIERLRPDAKRELRLLRDAGYRLSIVSGDTRARVEAIAAELGVPGEDVASELSPDDKARWIDAHDANDVLVLGDGINDGPAASRAFTSGTPAIDRPFMAARTDFYVVTEGLHPVRTALRVATHLRRVVRRNLAVALGYNVITVGLAAAGLLSPLACAVLMPLSSLSTVLTTTFSFSKGSRAWT